MIIIAGAGIGGLTLALALHRHGLPCRVFESARDLRPLGVGINLQPHAVKELCALGLLEALDAIAIRTREVAYFNSQGQKIWAEPRGRDAGYDWPQFSIHRGEFQFMLLDAVRARLGPDAVVSGARVTGWRATATGVDVDVATARGAQIISGAALIGCDGIHAATRRRMHPDEGPPVWSGTMLWRATTIAPKFLSGASMAMAGDRNRKFVCYPIAETEDGQSVVNWIADLRYPDDHPWKREDWNRPGDPSEILPRFADWTFDWLDVPALIRGAEAIYEFPMIDRDPLPAWTMDGATLLGDAAHAMYPIGSNGATQAILDASVLARELRRRPAPEALAAYEAIRRPATAAIVKANRGDGPDQVLDIVAARAPNGFDRLEDAISQAELHAVAARYKTIAGFRVEDLNAAPALLDA